MNKHFGLKKLKKIAGRDPRWFVSPHIVYSSPEQLRLARMRGQPRLLVRTDEAGRTYNHLSHYAMPRFDVPGFGLGGHKDRKNAALRSLGEKEIQKRLASAKGKVNFPPGAKNMLRFIVHPTGKREDIAWTGSVLVHSEITRNKGRTVLTPKIEIVLTPNPDPKETVHINLIDERDISFNYKNGKFTFDKDYSQRKSLKRNKKQENALISRIKELIQSAIDSNQIKFSRTTQIQFLTWKKDPTKIELYDLKESRYAGNTAKPLIK